MLLGVRRHIGSVAALGKGGADSWEGSEREGGTRTGGACVVSVSYHPSSDCLNGSLLTHCRSCYA